MGFASLSRLSGNTRLAGLTSLACYMTMWFVYILKSINHAFIYIGFTNDLDKRLNEHNQGLTQSTKHYAPFVLEAYVAVKTKKKAIELEKYFKTGSGKAILKKRILSNDQPNDSSKS